MRFLILTFCFNLLLGSKLLLSSDYQEMRENLRALDHRLDNLLESMSPNANQESKISLGPKADVDVPSIEKSKNIKNNDLGGWDLFVLRELALRHSPELLIKKAEISEFEKEVSVSKFGYYPTASAKVSYNDYAKISQFETYSEPEPYKTFSYGLDGRWTLYNGFKTRKQVEQANLELDKSRISLIFEEQEVLKNLTNHFFTALSSQAKLKFLPEIEEVINQRLSVYKKQLSSGVVDSLLVNNAVRDLENMRSQSLESKLSMELAKAEMNLLLDTDEKFWENQDSFISPRDFKVDSIFKIEDSISGKLGQAGIDIAKSKYELIESEASPVLELIASTAHNSRNRLAFDSTGHEVTFGLNLSVPISGRFLTRRKLEKAKYEINKSELLKNKLIKQQRNQFETENFKLVQSEKTLKLQEELWKLQKERLDNIMSMFSKRMSDKSVILMEKETLLRREMALELSRLSYMKQKYILELIN
jgi:outer membrane protein